MDNIQGFGTTVAPAQGQAPATSQMPSSDAGGNTTAPVESGAARTDGQLSAGQEGLILGKFRSQGDLEKAYLEAERQKTKSEMDRAELEKLFIGQTDNPSTPPTADAPVPVNDNPFQPVADELAPLLRTEMGKVLSPVLARMEIDSMVRKHGDAFVALAQETKAKQASNPSLSLEDAYKLASFDQTQRTSQAQSQQRLAAAQAQAQVAQVETSQPSGYRPVSVEEAATDPNVPVLDVVNALGPDYAAFAEVSQRRSYKKV